MSLSERRDLIPAVPRKLQLSIEGLQQWRR